MDCFSVLAVNELDQCPSRPHKLVSMWCIAIAINMERSEAIRPYGGSSPLGRMWESFDTLASLH